MTDARDFRTLIGSVVHEVWPQLLDGPAWIESQVQVESRGNPLALSPVGAVGLLQLMPSTADEMGVSDTRDPEQNLRGGVRYLREQFDHLPEIPLDSERLLWAFASYNCGRGYVNRALKLAKLDEPWDWWKWDAGKHWLMHRDCYVISGRYPEYRQVWGYLAKIRDAKAAYL